MTDTFRRVLFIGGPWHLKDSVVKLDRYFRVPAERERHWVLSPPRSPTEAMAPRYFEAVDYRLELWRTRLGEEFPLYCIGENQKTEELFRPIAEIIDQLDRPSRDPVDTGFGPGKLFLAVGLLDAWRQFCKEIAAVTLRHRMIRRAI